MPRPRRRVSLALRSIAVVTTLALLAALPAGTAWACEPAPGATPEALPRPDPSAVKECGERVRKGGIGLFGLGAIIGLTGAALLYDGAHHPDSKNERNAGWIGLLVGVGVAAPGLYLWIRGQRTINQVEAEAKAGKVSTVTPVVVPGGGGMGYLKTF